MEIAGRGGKRARGIHRVARSKSVSAERRRVLRIGDESDRQARRYACQGCRDFGKLLRAAGDQSVRGPDVRAGRGPARTNRCGRDQSHPLAAVVRGSSRIGRLLSAS